MTSVTYKKYATSIRIETLKMIARAKSSHIGSNFSAIDILTVLYNGILRVNPKNQHAPNRDRFILSKGHACASLYAILADKGFFSKKLLETFQFCRKRFKIYSFIRVAETLNFIIVNDNSEIIKGVVRSKENRFPV